MKLFNRDLSWLSFNHRVLQEAQDRTVPLFERIKFLAIFSSNLKEFFRVRVAYIRSLSSLKKKSRKDLDFVPSKLLQQIYDKVDKLQNQFGKIFEQEIIPELGQNNIFLINENQLNPTQRTFVKEFFLEKLYPNINPMILVKGKFKPFLKTGILYLAVRLSALSKHGKKKKSRFKYAVVEIPTDKISRFIFLPANSDQTNIIFLDDILRFCFTEIFEGYNIEEMSSFKLTRDAELYIEDEFSGNLLEKVKKNLSKRVTGLPSRFLYDEGISDDFLKFLRESFKLVREDLVPGGKYHNFSDFMNFPLPFNKDLEYESFNPINNLTSNPDESIFDRIKIKDSFIHFPYESFNYVSNFFESASKDPYVTEIKITLYRVATNSSIIHSLFNALKNGKKVTIFIEIKARFDEESNIEYARSLELAGARIIYSIPGLKVHAKLSLIIRSENDAIKKYCYLSTGNFNEKTAKIYTDFGYFTSDQRLTEEVSHLFNYLEGKIKDPVFENLLVAQFNMKKNLLRLIDNEIVNSRNGKKSSITLKLNNLEDLKMIQKLNEASGAGVKINIIVRGVCCLIPETRDLPGHFNVISVVDRFLEHSRVFIFYNNGDEKVFLSSADWMKRNLSRRIEVAFPVFDLDLKNKIIEMMNIQLNDNVKARVIDRQQNNEYSNDNGSIKHRAQIETYEYLKRQIPQLLILYFILIG